MTRRAGSAWAAAKSAFFVPSPAFLAWLPRHAAGRRVVDCGAGSGLLEHGLRRSGCANVLSMDIRPWSGRVAEVLEMGSTDFPFRETDLAVICRPCHDFWIELTVAKANNRGAEALYVGLPRNTDSDLPAGLLGEGARHAVRAGRDGEEMVGFVAPAPRPGRRAIPRPGESMVSLPHWDAPQPMRDGGDRWVSRTGTWFLKGDETVMDPEAPDGGEPGRAPGR